MNFKEAGEACIGQEYAMEFPLVPLPQPAPSPTQEAIIICKACTEPSISTDWIGHPNGDLSKVEARLLYAPRMTPCIKGETPDCGNCKIAKVAKTLTPHNVVMSKKQYESGNLSKFRPKI